MKTLSTMSQAILCLAVVFLAMIFTPTASAVGVKELVRVSQNQLFQGRCCFSWVEKVQVTEKETVEPVIVNWSTDYQATSTFLAGIQVNDGPCTFFSWFQPFRLADGVGDFDSHYFQWVILPSDGLVPGKNTFTLCGGAIGSPTAKILLGANTLSVRIAR
jgi:hypothetical protein